ncbi:hypothetical protein TNCV_2345111 [Trichonephila clavipes]|nr:hypothetical protein TNCV_2345111 [Trichonephila clavipes]
MASGLSCVRDDRGKLVRKRSIVQQENSEIVESIKKKQVACAQKEKQRPVKRLGRSNEESETEFCSKSTRLATCELGMPQKTVWKILRKKLNFEPYHLQLTQQKAEYDNFRLWPRQFSGQRNGLAAGELKSCTTEDPTTKDPPCRAAMHAKSVES